MAYRRSALDPRAPELPAPSMPALGMLEPDGPHLAQHALDTLVSSCRVLGAWGLQGQGLFTISDAVAPTSAGAYPDADTERVVLRLYGVPLTPGHLVGLDVVALPSGPTQWDVGGGVYEESGRGGQVRALVTYYNGDTETADASAVVSPSSSFEVYGAEPGSHHYALETYEATANPFGMVPSMVDRQRFLRGGDVLVDVVVTYTGSPRVLDFAIVERPHAMVVDQADAEWPSNMYSAGGQPYEGLPAPYPITQLSTTDPGGGVAACRRALEQHGLQLGPCLAWQASGLEGSDLEDWVSYGTGTGDDEAPPISSSSTTFVQLPFMSAPTANYPGFQLGNYARQARDSDEWLDGRTGVLPVWATVYAKAADATFQWRMRNDEWSAIDLAVTGGGSWGWFITPGWIEIGVSPEQGAIGRLLGKGGGSTWNWRYGGLFFRQR